jgi:opacity protein-like surface antigen
MYSYSGPVTGSIPGTYTTTVTQTCGGRKWTFGEGMSPVGVQLNFRPHHRIQPVFSGLGGYMFSTEPIPVAGAGSFNFTFELGAGVEFYQSRELSSSLFGNRSMRVEYRYHHISNHDTADQNPGIDSGTVQITYAFGR